MPAAKPAKEEEEGRDERAGLGKSGPALRGGKRVGHKEGGPGRPSPDRALFDFLINNHIFN